MADLAPPAAPSPLPATSSAWSFGQLRRRFRPRPPSAITALDIHGQTLWVVQAAPRGSRVAITRVEGAPLALAPDIDRTDPVALGQAVASTLASLKLKPPAVVMGVPRAQLVLRTLTLPVVQDIRELASIVHFQMGKDLPFRAEDAVIDFKVHRCIEAAPASEAGKSEGASPAGAGSAGNAAATAPTPRLEILVAAVHRDVVAFSEQLAEAAGLRLAAIGLRAYANARCLQSCSVSSVNEAVALVTLRPDEVSIDVMVEEELLFSRGAVIKSPPDPGEPPPLPDAADESADPPVSLESFVEAATIEVVRTLHGYGGTAARSPVTKVVVAGASGHEESVVQALSKRLSVPCSLLDPAGALGLESESREPARGAIAAIGLALGYTDPEGLPFDFLAPKQPAVQRDLRRIRILAGLAACIALFLVVILVKGQLMQRRLAVKRAVQNELSEADKKRPIYRAMRQQAATVEEWKRGERNWLDHYAYLSAILPASEEVYVTSLNISPQGVIRLGVQARSGEILSRLDKQLRAAGYEIKPLAITPGADRHGYDFSSTVELTVPDKMRFDLAKVRPPGRPTDDASLDPGVLKGGRP